MAKDACPSEMSLPFLRLSVLCERVKRHFGPHSGTVVGVEAADRWQLTLRWELTEKERGAS